MYRLGLIGCGRIVEEGHAPALLQLDERVQVVALADPSEERRTRLGGLLAVPDSARYADYTDMLRAERLDIVDVAVPHFLHRDVARAAAAAGAHLFLEKPMAVSLAEADAILEAVDAAGVSLCVAHNYLSMPHHAAALRLIAEGAIGRPFLIRHEGLGGSHYFGAAGYDPHWRTRAAQAGGGCLIDNAYHNLYLAETMMAAPVERVYARAGTFVQPIDVEDTALIFLEHAGGGTSSLQVSWAVKGGGARVHEVHGTEGSIAFGREGQPLALFRNSRGEWEAPDLGPEQEPAAFFRASFLGLWRDFLTALENGAPSPVDGRQARRNLQLVVAAYEAARTGQPVPTPLG